MRHTSIQIALTCDTCRSPSIVTGDTEYLAEKEAQDRGWTHPSNPDRSSLTCYLDLCPSCSKKRKESDLFHVNRKHDKLSAQKHGCEACIATSEAFEAPYLCPTTHKTCKAWRIELRALPWGNVTQ